MRVYTCKISDDEMFSDGFPMKIVDSVVAEVTTEQVESDNDEGVQVNNLVQAFNLSETSITKKAFKAYFKEYIKKIHSKMPSDRSEAEVTTWKENMAKQYKRILGVFDECDFYTGCSMEPDASIGVLWWDGAVPKFLFFVDAFNCEKV